MTFAAAMAVSGAVGIALTPGEPSGSLVAFGATGLLGVGIGAFFPLALTLPVDAARSPSEAASISALMLLIGYLLSSIAPVFLGLIRDATGNFELVLWVLVGLAIAMIPLALALGPGRLRRAEAV
jgi:CP family cyanate transporter-like MFS transporter